MPVTKVVILNWNGSAHLRTFLPAVIRTTPPDVGIVVVDNGSTDDSREVLQKEFPSVELLELNDNYGFAEGYNRALTRIDTDYCILLNSDVAPSEGWCEPLIAALASDRKLAAVQPKIRAYASPEQFEYAGACGGFIDMFGYPFCRGRILDCVETDNGQYDTYRHCFWASGACMACRRDVFLKAGGFDADFFAHMEEIDFCWRAQRYGYGIAVEPASVVYHLGGGTLPSTSPRKTYLNYRNNLFMLYKNLPLRRLWYILPLRMILDGLSAAVYLLQGKRQLVSQVWKAHMDFYKSLSIMRAKRRFLKNDTASAHAQKPVGIYHGSILIRYFTGNRKFDTMM